MYTFGLRPVFSTLNGRIRSCKKNNKFTIVKSVHICEQISLIEKCIVFSFLLKYINYNHIKIGTEGKEYTMYKDLDSISIEEYIFEGVILIDKNGTIIKYNSKAKEILGLTGYNATSHQAGKLESEDILLFADTSVGEDDGGLNTKILKAYGVKYDKPLEKKGLLYIGKKDVKNSVHYSVIEYNDNKAHELKCNMDGQKLYCAIDYYNKETTICVDSKEYKLNYILNIANVVIIRNKELAFYQIKGYTARKESLFDIMCGIPFKKKDGMFNLDVEGKNIYSFHAENSLTVDLVNCASGNCDGYIENKLSNINGFTVMASIHPVNIGEERCGALLTMSDISMLEKNQNELNAVLNELENLKRHYQTNDLFPEIIGSSLSMKEVKRVAMKAANSDANILILGESGTGKSFIAKKIHEKSKRNKFPFVEINCCAIPKELLESELFGYENGAFTGARPDGKKGIFEIADEGTVFLDEIGDMPLEMQAKLLLFIQKRSFYRVGGNTEIHVDVRIITATNKNLEDEIKNKHFREDLFYRLYILPIYIEPLKRHKEDISQLIDYNMKKNNASLDEHKVLSVQANKMLLSYNYPGNVRELENIIERAFVLSEGEVIYPEHLMLKRAENTAGIDIREKTLDKLMAAYEKKVILEALKLNEQDYIKTFEYLGIGKTCFYNKLKKYGIK